MRIIVQKFGGTSLSTNEARIKAINHIHHSINDGFRVVVVVSAMGRRGDPYATDTLLDWIHDHGASLESRETDLLLSCGEIISAATLCSMLRSQGTDAVVLTGGQAGILTTDRYGNARIQSIRTDRIRSLLQSGKVVIVTGFQGVTMDHEVTTLGRGGSDTSATALGVALSAEVVDIFSDVCGVYTADPKIVANARPLLRVSYEEVCNMAYLGAKVIHPRAVEIAMQGHVPIRVRSTFEDGDGTTITHVPNTETDQIVDVTVTGIAHSEGLTQINIAAEFGQYDLHLKVFKTMADHDISVDFIHVAPSGVAYTVFERDTELAVSVLRRIGLDPYVIPECAKVSVIGGGMNGVPGVMARIVEALIAKDIHILQTSDSNASIWVLVQRSSMKQAVIALHEAFELSKL